MRRRAHLGLWLVVALSCSSDDTVVAAPEEIVTPTGPCVEGELSCGGEMVRICALAAKGELDWVDYAPPCAADLEPSCIDGVSYECYAALACPILRDGVACGQLGCFDTHSCGEGWSGSLGTGNALGVATTADGHRCVTGYAEAPNGTPSFALRCAIWPSLLPLTWGPDSGDGIGHALTIEDEAVLVVGSSEGPMHGAPHVFDYDASVTRVLLDQTIVGSTLWGTAANDIALDIVGGGVPLVVGVTFGDMPGHTQAGAGDAFATALDATDDVLWTTQWGTLGQDRAAVVVARPAGGWLVLGTTDGTFPAMSNDGGVDLFVSSVSAGGVVGWTMQWGDGGGEVAPGGIVEVEGDGIYVSGTVDTSPFTLKLTDGGAVTWRTDFGETGRTPHRLSAEGGLVFMVTSHAAHDTMHIDTIDGAGTVSAFKTFTHADHHWRSISDALFLPRHALIYGGRNGSKPYIQGEYASWHRAEDP